MRIFDCGLLRWYRRRNKIFLADAAAFIGRHPMSLSYYENGKSDIRMKDFTSLCRLYNVEPKSFFVEKAGEKNG